MQYSNQTLGPLTKWLPASDTCASPNERQRTAQHIFRVTMRAGGVADAKSLQLDDMFCER